MSVRLRPGLPFLEDQAVFEVSVGCRGWVEAEGKKVETQRTQRTERGSEEREK